MLSELHVLVVDDQRSMRSIIRSLLQQERVGQVSEAENGLDALQLMTLSSEHPPDIVICDLYMEKMDGLEFVNKLRLAKNNTPVIILTGEKDPFVQDVTRQAGAATVLTKPISAPDLANEVRRVVGFG